MHCVDSCFTVHDVTELHVMYFDCVTHKDLLLMLAFSPYLMLLVYF